MEKLNHAIVVGGSMAGLAAAGVLARHFEAVTVIERDELREAPLDRPGTPQARHVHGMLTRGLRTLEEIFPGIRNELISQGAEMLDAGGDMAWRTPYGWGVRVDCGLETVAASRSLMEHVTRRQLAMRPNVTFMDQTRVEGLLAVGDRVVGVAQQYGISMRADLVVDATGRGSNAPSWLEVLRYPKPEEVVLDPHAGYATRLFRRCEGDVSWKGLVVQTAPPIQVRGGIALPTEGGGWLVTLMGGDCDYPPTTETGFLSFARSLPTQELYNLIVASEPLSPIYGFRNMRNCWRRYDRMKRVPEGFIALGDSVCALNPIYPQGMTIAALGAQALDGCLKSGSRATLTRRFQKRLAEVVTTPWAMATSSDARFRSAGAPAPGLARRIMRWYFDRVAEASTQSAAVHMQLLRVFSMVDEPSALFRPSVIHGALFQSRVTTTEARRLATPAV